MTVTTETGEIKTYQQSLFYSNYESENMKAAPNSSSLLPHSGTDDK